MAQIGRLSPFLSIKKLTALLLITVHVPRAIMVQLTPISSSLDAVIESLHARNVGSKVPIDTS